MKMDEKHIARCSFCGKSQDDVTRIFAGRNAFICNECVSACVRIMQDDMTLPVRPKEAGLLGEDGRLPLKSACTFCSLLFSPLQSGSVSTCRSSDINSGFEQNAVTPASLASCSMSDQSYAVRIMIGELSPTRFLILRTVSMPLRSGIMQSIIYALNSSELSSASLALITASLP